MKKILLLLAFNFIVLLSFGQLPEEQLKKHKPIPLFFLDSVLIDQIDLINFDPDDIAVISMLKGQFAVELLGEKAKNGVVYMETKGFAKKRYWNYFKSKSIAYSNLIPKLNEDNSIQYILNGKILKRDFEGDLASIKDDTFKTIKILSKRELIRNFRINNKKYGVLIVSGSPSPSFIGQN